jgi:hypothetical protein
MKTREGEKARKSSPSAAPTKKADYNAKKVKGQDDGTDVP